MNIFKKFIDTMHNIMYIKSIYEKRELLMKEQELTKEEIKKLKADLAMSYQDNDEFANLIIFNKLRGNITDKELAELLMKMGCGVSKTIQ